MISEEDIIKYHQALLDYLKKTEKGILICSFIPTEATKILEKHGYKYKRVSCVLCDRLVIFPDIETSVKPVCVECYLNIAVEVLDRLGGDTIG